MDTPQVGRRKGEVKPWPRRSGGVARFKSAISAAGLLVPSPAIDNSSHYKSSSQYLVFASIPPSGVLDRHKKMNGGKEDHSMRKS